LRIARVSVALVAIKAVYGASVHELHARVDVCGRGLKAQQKSECDSAQSAAE